MACGLPCLLHIGRLESLAQTENDVALNEIRDMMCDISGWGRLELVGPRLIVGIWTWLHAAHDDLVRTIQLSLPCLLSMREHAYIPPASRDTQHDKSVAACTPTRCK